MIHDYRSLGDSGPRPFLDVLIGPAGFRVTGLVDSGATTTVFHTDVAAEAGIDLSTAEVRPLLLGPGRGEAEAHFLTLPLDAGGLSWEAEVGLCTSVPPQWGILGTGGFFRFFTVTFRAVDAEFEIEPINA